MSENKNSTKKWHIAESRRWWKPVWNIFGNGFGRCRSKEALLSSRLSRTSALRRRISDESPVSVMSQKIELVAGIFRFGKYPFFYFGLLLRRRVAPRGTRPFMGLFRVVFCAIKQSQELDSADSVLAHMAALSSL